MRKVLFLILALLVLLSFAACGHDGSATPAEDEKELDLEQVYQAIIDAQTESGMDELIFFEEAKPEILDGFYPGLSDLELVQSHYYLPPVLGYACEIVLIELANKDDVDAAKAILQARIDMASADTYYPENAEGWIKNSQIQQQGRYLCLIVLPEGYVIPNSVFDLK